MKTITPVLVRSALPKRKLQSQKWDYGHCLVIAGSRNLFGAALLTTKSALRGGAGLVTLATPKSLQPLIYSHILEALTLPLDETPDGTIDFPALLTVTRYIQERGVNSVVLGPGLTRDPQTAKFIHGLMKEVKVPMVVDADAINVRPAVTPGAFRCLTPHVREWARFLGVSIEEVKDQGIDLAEHWSRENSDAALVLKGHQTKIFFKEESWMNTTGNSGMAKGGSGDVLSGLIGAFLAQKDFHQSSGQDYVPAVAAAVYLHGLAGDLAAHELTANAMNAQDIIDFLPAATKKTLKF